MAVYLTSTFLPMRCLGALYQFLSTSKWQSTLTLAVVKQASFSGFSYVEKAVVPQRRQDRPRCYADVAFNISFVLRTGRSGRYDRSAIVTGHVGIGGI